jgi:hypothetical protein
MNIVDWVVRQLEHHGALAVENYVDVLKETFADHPPPFGAKWYEERFAELAENPRWIATQLLGSAQGEGEGARNLWQLAACALDPFISEQVRLHAIDESRHSKMYGWLLAEVFPDLTSQGGIAKLNELSPGYTLSDYPLPQGPKSDARVLDELAQTNLSEIRTCKNTVLLRPVLLRLCKPKHVQRVSWVIDRLLFDEINHIRYTAQILDAACVAGNRALVRHIFTERTREFSAITLREVGGAERRVERKAAG